MEMIYVVEDTLMLMCKKKHKKNLLTNNFYCNVYSYLKCRNHRALLKQITTEHNLATIYTAF